jgi:hypothetical protein
VVLNVRIVSLTAIIDGAKIVILLKSFTMKWTKQLTQKQYDKFIIK